MNAAPATAEPSTPPDPAQDRCEARSSARSSDQAGDKVSVPEGIARLLCLVQWIIGYGQRLAASVQHSAPGDDLGFFTLRFHTSDLTAILTRIQRGLMLAAGLQDRLRQRAATGRDVKPALLRSAGSGRRGDGKPGQQRAPRRTNIVDLPLDRLPSAEEIASELERRPLGAIIVDICRDLGITPNDLPRELQDLLKDAIYQYGGSLWVLLFKEATARLRKMLAAEVERLRALPLKRAPRRRPAAAAATGPP